MQITRGRSKLSYTLTSCFVLTACTLPFLVACGSSDAPPKTVTEVRYVYSCPSSVAAAPSLAPTHTGQPMPTTTAATTVAARPTTTPPPVPPPPPPAAPTYTPIGVTGPGCVIRGTSPMPKGTAIYDAPTGGRLIATFTGGFAPMSISDIPPDPATQRSKLSTHANEPSVRIDGFVDTSVIPMYSSRDIPIVANSIWIASAQKLKITGASAGAVNVEMPIFGTNGQIVKATTPCESLALQRGTPQPLPVPGDGRGFLATQHRQLQAGRWQRHE